MKSLFIQCVHIHGWFSTGSDFAPKGTLDNIRRHIWLSQLRVGVIWWAQARDACKYPTVHRTAPATNYLVPNANSTEVEEPWHTLSHLILINRVVLCVPSLQMSKPKHKKKNIMCAGRGEGEIAELRPSTFKLFSRVFRPLSSLFSGLSTSN